MSNPPNPAGGSGQPNPQVEQAKQMWNNLSRGRQIGLVGAVVGLIATFLPWYGISAGSFGSNSWSAWGGGIWSLLAILSLLVGGAVILTPLLMGPNKTVRGMIPSLPPTVTDARIVLGAGVAVVVFTLLFIVTSGHSSADSAGISISAGPSFGAYVAIICGAAIAYAGYTLQSEV